MAYKLDLAAYLDALAVLGLQPGATIADIRGAHKARMKACHPDLFPGDLAKAREAKAMNAARDLLERMSRDGSLADFSLMAEARRRSAPPPAEFVVLLVVAPAGLGKTLGWAKATARRSNCQSAILVLPEAPRHVILASPTIALIDQTVQALTALGLTAPVVTVIHGGTARDGVAPAMRDYFVRTQADQDAVLLCSHAAIFDTPTPSDPENWDLVFDEMPDAVMFQAIDAPDTHWHLTRHVTATSMVGGTLYRLTPLDDNMNSGAAMRRLARIARNRPFDAGLEPLRAFADALIHAHLVLVPMAQWDELVAVHVSGEKTQFGGHLDALTIVPPSWFQQYRSITMLGARCWSHLTTLLWQRVWHVAFGETDRFNLPRWHTPRQSARLTIHWLFEQRATRAFLARPAVGGGTMFEAVCQSVAQFHKGRSFLWSAPRPGDDRQHGVDDAFWSRRGESLVAFEPMLRLPGRTHGLNDPRFLSTCAVALLSAVHFTPAQYTMLHELGLSNAELDKALAFDVAYQDAMRCDLRQVRGTKPVHITVLDQATALDLAAAFPGCRVERFPAELIPEPQFRTGKRGPASTGTARSSTTRSRAYRARQAARRTQQYDVKRES
jgi:hypothetical protein